MFCLFAQQIDYFTDNRTADAQPRQDLFVFNNDLVAHQPDKRVPFDPAPEKVRAWILRRDFQGFESRDPCYQDGCVDYASRPFSFWRGQRQ